METSRAQDALLRSLLHYHWSATGLKFRALLLASIAAHGFAGWHVFPAGSERSSITTGDFQRDSVGNISQAEDVWCDLISGGFISGVLCNRMDKLWRVLASCCHALARASGHLPQM